MVLLVFLLFGLLAPVQAASGGPNIVPQPQQVELLSGFFEFRRSSTLAVNHKQARPVAEYFAAFVAPASGFSPAIKYNKNPVSGAINFVISREVKHPEGYRLSVKPERVVITASTAQGLFYGVQTLRQLLPAELEGRMPINRRIWPIPAVEVRDAPRYAYRGMHLDVARSFFPKAFIKRYIDLLAMHKLNVFHWHLTDDQGWRVEIKRYPKLTEIGAWRDQTVVGHTYDYEPLFDGQRHGGYYTQDDIREIVRYAAERHIQVIPEIDIPGHATAILAAYPELACQQRDFKVESRFGIFENILCPTEETFTFLTHVFAEVAELFPSPYLHIGGDEVVKNDWKHCPFCQDLMRRENLKNVEELQSYFVRRVERIANKLDKTIIGWDEILQDGIRPSATIMSWRGTEGGIQAAKQGHDVIMAPYQWLYFDHYQSRNLDEPKAIHGLTTLRTVYEYEPTPKALNRKQAKHILGATGALWTEYIRTPRAAEYMLLPRLSAFAEVVWSPAGQRDWQRFTQKLPALYQRYKQMGVNASHSAYAVQGRSRVNDDRSIGVELFTDVKSQLIRYTLDGSQPSIRSPEYKGVLRINKPVTLRATSQDLNSGRLYGDYRLTLKPHKALQKNVTFKHEPKEGGRAVMFDGVMAYDQHYNVGDWGVFYGKDLEVIIDLGQATMVQSVQMGVDAGRHRQLHPPATVNIALSVDNINWQTVASLDERSVLDQIPLLDMTFAKQKARYVRVRAVNSNNSTDPQIPELPLYIDEVIVH